MLLKISKALTSAEDLASVIVDKKSPKKAEKFYKKHPLVSALAALGAIGTGAWGIHHVIYGNNNTDNRS